MEKTLWSRCFGSINRFLWRGRHVGLFRENVDDDILPSVFFFAGGLKPFLVNMLASSGNGVSAGVISPRDHEFYVNRLSVSLPTRPYPREDIHENMVQQGRMTGMTRVLQPGSLLHSPTTGCI
jgi:hypothetical protein